MPAIVALPQVVEELLLQFGDIFPNEPARVHFAEYITGLLVAALVLCAHGAFAKASCPGSWRLGRAHCLSRSRGKGKAIASAKTMTMSTITMRLATEICSPPRWM